MPLLFLQGVPIQRSIVSLCDAERLLEAIGNL